MTENTPSRRLIHHRRSDCVHDWRVRGDGQMQCRTCFYIAPDRPFAEPEPHEPSDYCVPGCLHNPKDTP